MAIKLKLVLENPRLALGFKTLIFGGFLLLVKIGGFGILPVLFFLLAAYLLFLKPLFQTVAYFLPFTIFIVLGLLFLNRLPGYYSLAGILSLALLFYLLMGIKGLTVVNRPRAYLIFNLSLFYLVFLLFFLSGKESGFILKLLSVFLAALFLFRDLFKFQTNFSIGWRRAATLWILALLVFESVWAISLLPIGFLQSANLALLTVFILQNLAFKHFQGVLNRRAILNDATIFILLTLLIFMTSRWGI